MPITINGSGTITGLSVGGLPDGTVDTDTLASGTIPAEGNPLIRIDRWRLNANVINSNQVITAWERPDGSNQLVGSLGTGVSHSSGIFTFPVTGVWEARVYMGAEVTNNDDIGQIQFLICKDNSNYQQVAFCRLGQRGSGDSWQQATGSTILDITDVSNQKIKFQTDSCTSTTVQGDTNTDVTYVDFIRWGDT